MNMERVCTAEAYRIGAMGAVGRASSMLVRQNAFPNEYDPKLDKLVLVSHDRIRDREPEHCRRCFDQHAGGELQFEWWTRDSDPQKIFAFLKDIMKADPKIAWTGFRILGTVNERNGHDVWELQLFAKHPKSKTVVYDTHNVPGLKPGSRHGAYGRRS